MNQRFEFCMGLGRGSRWEHLKGGAQEEGSNSPQSNLTAPIHCGARRGKNYAIRMALPPGKISSDESDQAHQPNLMPDRDSATFLV